MACIGEISVNTISFIKNNAVAATVVAVATSILCFHLSILLGLIITLFWAFEFFLSIFTLTSYHPTTIYPSMDFPSRHYPVEIPREISQPSLTDGVFLQKMFLTTAPDQWLMLFLPPNYTSSDIIRVRDEIKKALKDLIKSAKQAINGDLLDANPYLKNFLSSSEVREALNKKDEMLDKTYQTLRAILFKAAKNLYKELPDDHKIRFDWIRI